MSGPCANTNNMRWQPPSLFPFILTVNSIWVR
jgi:cytoskeletal protein RodZ